MDVSVILVNFNNDVLLSNAIESIERNTMGLKYEIIVVDNSSVDDSGKIISGRFGERIKYIRLKENIGFGRANNEGIKIAIGRNVFLLNPDTVLLNNAIKILSDFIDENTGTGIAGGNLYNNDMQPAYSFRRFLPSVFWELNDMMFALPEKLLFGKNAHFNNLKKPLNVGYITGADLMIARDKIERAGIFDTDYFLFFEETDLALRIKKLGFNIKNVPEAKIQHLEGASFNSDHERSLHYMRGKLTFYRKNFNPVYQYALKIIMLISFNLRIIIFSLFFNSLKAKKWKTLAKIYYKVVSEMDSIKIIN